MASASVVNSPRQIQVFLVPESHDREGTEAIKTIFIPVLQELLPHNIKEILNVTEGTTLTDGPDFFNALYHPHKNFIHAYEYLETSTNYNEIKCLKLILTIFVIIQVTLEEMYRKIKNGEDIHDIMVFKTFFGDALSDRFFGNYLHVLNVFDFIDSSHIIIGYLNTAYLTLYQNREDLDYNYNHYIKLAFIELAKIFQTPLFTCTNKDSLVELIRDVLRRFIAAGMNFRERSDAITYGKTIIRDMLDKQLILKIERIVRTKPDIKCVVINIGENHYSNTKNLVDRSDILVINQDFHDYIMTNYKKLEGGKRKRKTTKNRRKKSKKSKKE